MTRRTRSESATRRADRALCLRRFPYGESSLVLHALTPGAGRVAWLAKGAYRPHSAFFAVFDLFDTLDVRWSAQPHQELGLVTRAAIRTRRLALSNDLGRYRAALTLLELAHLTAREDHEEAALFRWLEQGLDLLEAARASTGLILASAQLALLRANGLAPALRACASCGTPLRERGERGPFSFALGGRLCPGCAGAERALGRTVEEMTLNVVRVAESLMALPPEQLAHTRLNRRLEVGVGSLVGRFLDYHLETRPRTSWNEPSPVPRP